MAETTVSRSHWVFMDAGDTFIYGYPTLYEALQDCFRHNGQEISQEAIRLEVHTFMKQRPPVNLNRQIDFTGYFESLYSTVLSHLEYSGNYEKTVEYLWDEWRHARRLRLFDDARQALLRLRRIGYRLAVISNWDNTFHNTLKLLGVHGLFDVLVCSVEQGVSKPDLRIFQKALDLASPLAEPIWYLGDQIEMDILPANELGFQTILVDYYGKHTERGPARYYAFSMSVAAMQIEQATLSQISAAP